MDHQFKRLLNLVRRTGDRLVVTDPNGEDTYVLMGLEAYEKLADRLAPPEPEPWAPPCFDEFIHEDDDDDDEFDDDILDEDKIDDFDPNWQTPPELDNIPVQSITTEKAIWDVMPEAGKNVETWDAAKFGQAEQKIVEERFENEIERDESVPLVSLNEETKKEDKKDVETDKKDEFGEEQFYLEPIE